jgi:hypothetical protein
MGSYRPATGKRYPSIAVRDGQSHVTGVRITVRRDLLSIGGRVIDTAGEPISDAVISLSSSEYEPGLPSGTSDASGAFTIHDLSPGKYTVRAMSLHGNEHENNVTAGRTDLVIRFAEPGSIAGTLAGFTDPPLVFAFRVDGRNYRNYNAAIDGDAFRVRGISPGEYRVTASSASGDDNVTVTVAPGATAHVTLHGHALGAIVGTVVNATAHAPLAGLRCWGNPSSSGLGEDVVTDATGTYRIDRVSPGRRAVTCMNGSSSAYGEIEVAAGQTARLDLTARAHVAHGGYLGMTIDNTAGDVVVKSVDPGGPAARAGLAVGDLVLQIDDQAIDQFGRFGVQSTLESRAAGSTVKLKIERAEKELVVVLTIEAPP